MSRPTAVVSQPVVWVLIQAVLVAGVLQATGGFGPRVNPDTATYREMPLDSLAAALSHMRTFGYPVFLRVVGGDLAATYFQFAAFALAAAGFCAALRSVGYSRGAAGFAASVLLYSRVAIAQTGDVAADVLAAAFAVVSVSLLLVVVDRPRSVLAWVGLTTAVFLTYQTRPAYLFLVPLVPLVGFLLAMLVRRRAVRSAAGLGVGLFAATVVPLLAFCGLRGAVVGHFGLVSFGGYNLVGITGQFLDEELVEELSPELRPLARRVIERRRLVVGWKPPADYWAMEEMYNPTVWTLTVPAAEELYGGDTVRINRTVTALGREVIRLRPALYLRWLGWAGAETVRGSLSLFAIDPGVCLCLAVFLGSEAWLLWRWFRFGTMLSAPRPESRRFVEFGTLLWVGLAFAAAKGLLVILVEAPIGRYLTAGMIFLPSALAVLTWYRLAAVFGWRVADKPRLG